ncbi:hypothetical protein B0T26DRAFT_671257 [Lasiosphaeria miniovina]|uniref:RNA recognition motif-containing protein n=1 Tax=Lasiosphaeria miniovina TaxID=1954250 RepID=A0AA40BIW8_9PEZI|nr:uncharacterized protein B0T26DRAFT_671257 [Lasiosphaeria miniovina]KAK0735060.1 hypothetical protein B0T26DRAFT_671257 [Lasiosphaeria miniovina]
MAARPGEDNVATLFGDIHYFYGPPTDKPQHHRFDKGSYIYLFEDANQARARLEVANQPGTDDQDAFDGYLDKTQLEYSYKKSCVVTLTVGDVDGHEEWHLPTYDPHNQNKYHYKLHSLDIYFWTQQDALEFVNGIRRVLPPAQCEVLDEPGPPPRHLADVSSVVQQLERAAIADSDSSVATPPSTISYSTPSVSGAPSAGPPLSAFSGAGDLTPPPPPPQFAPIAYNPAAPPAPEQVRHREKTPPPDDDVANPLHMTMAYDAQTPFSPGLVPSGRGPLSPGIPPPNIQNPPGAPSFPAPPQHSVTSPGFAPQGFGALGGHPLGLSQHPNVHPMLSRSATMPVQSTTPAVPFMISGGYTPGSPPPSIPGGYTPGSPPPRIAGGAAAAAAPAPQAYNPAAPAASEYSVHQQFYIPESQYKPKVETRGKLEEGAGKVERGVTGMLKRFEKKFG